MMKRIFKTIFGVPPGTNNATSDSNVEATSQREFFCETELSMDEIHAVESEDSTLQKWRVDADGFQWYRRVSKEQTALMAAESLRTLEPITEDVDDDVFSDDSCGELEFFTADDFTDGSDEA